MPRVRIELTTFRLLGFCDYETDALPTALPRHMKFVLEKCCIVYIRHFSFVFCMCYNNYTCQ